MARLLDDWLTTFLDYTDHMEAPKLLRSWAGISSLASALRRKVWIDQDQFIWTPGLYIIFVGPPGVITKSTTTDMSTNLLREVPGIKFGPNNITWQALASAFAAASESFDYPVGSGDQNPMSAITLVARELGSLLNPKDGDLVNLFIELYDGAKSYQKVTKMSGDDSIECPWINMMGATTPSWIAENVPQSALGGGLISRVIFLYGDEKEKMVPYPKRLIRNKVAHDKVREALIHDLEHISMNLVGPYELTEEAYVWGDKWYKDLWTGAKDHYNDDKLMGYIARKQTHLHKVAMVLAASYKDELTITADDLQVAEKMLGSVEKSLDKVFAQIGKGVESQQAEKFIALVSKQGKVPYEGAYKLVHAYFPDFRDFEGVLNGAMRSGQLKLLGPEAGGQFFLCAPDYVDTRALPLDNPRPESPALPTIDTPITTPQGSK